MDRFILFLFLVLLLPGFVFWAGNGMAPAEETWDEFRHQVNLLRSGRHEPPPRPEPEPPPEPEAEKPQPEPETPAPEPEKPPVLDPRTAAPKLFSEGRFQEAADLYARFDAAKAAEARLAAVLSRAFPKRRFEGPYLVVKTAEGGRYEGFAQIEGKNLRLTRPSGLSLSLPEERIVTRIEKPAEEVMKPARELLEKAANGGKQERRRMLPLVESAFAMGQSDLAGRLIRRALVLDRSQPFLIEALSHRVPTTHRKDALRAYQAVTGTAAPPPNGTATVRTPRRLTNATKRKPKEPLVRDPEATKLMGRARILRRRAWELYDEIAKAGLKTARVEDVDEAIQKVEAAIDLYTQVLEIEDSDEVAQLIAAAAKRSRNLRFWKEQLDGR